MKPPWALQGLMRRGARGEIAGCREVRRVLQAHLDGELDDLTARRVARHLEACRRCGLEAGVYAEIKAALHRQQSSLDEATLGRLREFIASLEGDEPGSGRSSPGPPG